MIFDSQFIPVVSSGSQTVFGQNDALSINNKEDNFLLLAFFRGT